MNRLVLLLSLLTCAVTWPGPVTAAPAPEIAGPGGVRAFSVAQLRKLPAASGYDAVVSLDSSRFERNGEFIVACLLDGAPAGIPAR